MAKLNGADNLNGAHIGDSPSRKPEEWFNVSVGFVIFTGLSVMAGFVWVFATQDAFERVQRAQAIQPFGIALFALVTFCTVVWRGLISERQAEEQRRQNDANDEENVARLLVDGTKLLGEDREPMRLAGVSALQAVVVSTNKRMAQQAMNIIASQLTSEEPIKTTTQFHRMSALALNAGAQAGLRASSDIHFKGESEFTNWVAVNGAKLVVYWSGAFHKETFDFTDLENAYFLDTTFNYCGPIKASDSFGKGCYFEGCSITSVNARMIERCSFVTCDFSNADFIGAFDEQHLGMLKASGCYYLTGQPPRSTPPMQWTHFLTERQQHP